MHKLSDEKQQFFSLGDIRRKLFTLFTAEHAINFTPCSLLIGFYMSLTCPLLHVGIFILHFLFVCQHQISSHLLIKVDVFLIKFVFKITEFSLWENEVG